MRVNRRRNIVIECCYQCPSCKLIKFLGKFFCFHKFYHKIDRRVCIELADPTIDIHGECPIPSRNDLYYYTSLNPEKNQMLAEARERLSEEALCLFDFLKSLPQNCFSTNSRITRRDLKKRLQKRGWKVRTISYTLKELEAYHDYISKIIHG